MDGSKLVMAIEELEHDRDEWKLEAQNLAAHITDLEAEALQIARERDEAAEGRGRMREMLSDMLYANPGVTTERDKQAVRRLCEELGYGAVMHCASYLWQEMVGDGAFAVGPCKGTIVAELQKGWK